VINGGLVYRRQFYEIFTLLLNDGYDVVQLVEALRYKTEGPGFDFL
jgi:hypothetical protein